jgi:hypothetical protein
MSDFRILPHAESDLPIPPVTQILARASELRADAQRRADDATARQLGHLIDALNGGVRMVWVLGDLLVTSASTPHTVYTVSCGECNCPAYRPCKHLALAEVLLSLLETEADSMDMADVSPCQPWYTRQSAARSLVWARL